VRCELQEYYVNAKNKKKHNALKKFTTFVEHEGNSFTWKKYIYPCLCVIATPAVGQKWVLLWIGLCNFLVTVGTKTKHK